ncbi:MAG TPA: hypothetical protein VF260_00550 [Bacilli bacterium]
MLGMIYNDRECRELGFLLRKELDEMLLDLSDYRMNGDVREAIEARYQVIFKMYARVATPKELSKYARNKSYH